MGANEAAGFIAIAMSLIGFVTVWIKIGHDKGRQETIIKSLEQKTEKNEKEIGELKSETKTIQIEIARHIGSIEAKLGFIKDAITAIKGGRRAAEE